MKLLVGYATKYGSTAEIAEKIGAEIRAAGISVDVLPVHRELDVSEYDAVVLGSAVYMGRWLRDAVDYLKTNESMLANKEVWIFSTGPTGKGDPAKLLNNWNFPKRLMPILDHIQPYDVTVFHGALSPKKLTLVDRVIIRNVKAPTGDFRDWNMILSWAKGIVAELTDREIVSGD